MEQFTATIDSLFDAVIAFSARVVRAYIYADTPQLALPPHEAEVVAAPLLLTGEVVEDRSHTDTAVLAANPPAVPVTRGMVMYAGAPRVPVYKNPTIEFDAQIGTLPFGAMVMAGEPKGRFHYVTWNAVAGWVLQDDLADRAANIYPSFIKGKENLVDDPNTAQIRAIIDDVFGLSRSQFPLQAGEYILYRLKKRGLSIEWPLVRPRMPGMWHELLKGVRGIHISLFPRVGAIMEYTLPNDVGQLAYVEAVFPDGTISISEVNNPDSGIYDEREYAKDAWKELKPVFIEVR